jgi:hypothetical protein
VPVQHQIQPRKTTRRNDFRVFETAKANFPARGKEGAKLWVSIFIIIHGSSPFNVCAQHASSCLSHQVHARFWASIMTAGPGSFLLSISAAPRNRLHRKNKFKRLRSAREMSCLSPRRCAIVVKSFQTKLLLLLWEWIHMQISATTMYQEFWA